MKTIAIIFVVNIILVGLQDSIPHIKDPYDIDDVHPCYAARVVFNIFAILFLIAAIFFGSEVKMVIEMVIEKLRTFASTF